MAGLGDYPAAGVLRAESLTRAEKFYTEVLGLRRPQSGSAAVQGMLEALWTLGQEILLQELVDHLVGKPSLHLDDARNDPGIPDPPFFIDPHQKTQGPSFLTHTQTADPLGKSGRNHGNALFGKINRYAPRLGFPKNLPAFLQEGGYIGDVDPHLFYPVHPLQAQRIVHVAGVFAVNGQGMKEGQIAILGLKEKIRRSLHHNFASFVDNLFGKGLGNPVAQQKQILIFIPLAQANQDFEGSVGQVDLGPFQEVLGLGSLGCLGAKKDISL